MAAKLSKTPGGCEMADLLSIIVHEFFPTGEVGIPVIPRQNPAAGEPGQLKSARCWAEDVEEKRCGGVNIAVSYNYERLKKRTWA